MPLHTYCTILFSGFLSLGIWPLLDTHSPVSFYTQANMSILECPNDTIVAAQGPDCSAILFDISPQLLIDVKLIDTLYYKLSSGQTGNGFPSNLNLPEGTTTIHYYASSGNDFDSCSFNITVEDQTPPVIDCPQSATIRIDGTIVDDPDHILLKALTSPGCTGITIFFPIPTAADNCSEDITITQTNGLVTGSSFPLGTQLLQFNFLDEANNESTCEFSITVLPVEELVATISPNAAVCKGELVQLLPGGNAGFSYQWIGPDNFTSTEISPAIFASPETVGTYFVSCTNSQGCTALGNVTLELLPDPIFMASSNSPICGDSLFLSGQTANDSPPIAHWEWEGPCGFTSSVEDTIYIVTPICEGEYFLTATSSDGCISTSSTTVSTISIPNLTIQGDCNPTICLGESCLLFGSDFNPTPEEFVWTSDDTASGLPDNVNNHKIEITPTASGIFTYYYSVVIDGCAAQPVAYTIEVSSLPEAIDDEYDVVSSEVLENIQPIDNDTYSDQILFELYLVSPTQHGQVNLESDGSFSYMADPGFSGTDEFVYQLCAGCIEEYCDEATVKLNVNYEGICFIPTIITPNGDQTNDLLKIPCLESGDFPKNSLVVFNQWGDKVYSASPYKNNWEGTYNGEALPDGTYFYNFRRDEETQVVKGYFSIYK